MHTIYMSAYRTMMASLRQHRLDAGLRQADIARRLRCSRERITKLERGMLRLDVIQFIHTCRAYRTDPVQVLRDLDADVPDAGTSVLTYWRIPPRERMHLPSHSAPAFHRVRLSA